MTGAESNSALHDRTLVYTGGVRPSSVAGITSGPDTAATIAGQVAILTAVNIVSRVHPEVVISLPEVPLVVPSPAGGGTLAEACRRLALATNPVVLVSLRDGDLPAGVLSVGIGADAGSATVYAGGSSWTGCTSRQPVAITTEPSSLLGAGLAVTLATGFIFRVDLGRPAVAERVCSLWSLTETGEATGPTELAPLDIGTTWMVGAGAVGSCLAWWLHFVGVIGAWWIIDGDFADATNLNRSLGLFAADAGITGGDRRSKAAAAADLIEGAVPYPHWWDEWMATHHESPDVLIPVANDRGIRPVVAAYGHPATIHATTSANWTAELHRHLLIRDGCISCRLPEGAPAFKCATEPGEAPDEGQSNDAALPFLSAASGLMLLGGLLRLQHRHLAAGTSNHWRVFFDESATTIKSASWSCNQGCTATPPATARRLVHGHTTWHQLDPG